MFSKIYHDRFMKNEWHMENAERMALIYLLSRIKPSVSLEIGTFRGGSLAPIADFSEFVFTCDLVSPSRSLMDSYQNVEFVVGDSRVTLPPLTESLNNDRRQVNFVLIDGNHSTDAVLADLSNVLRLEVQTEMWVLFHDAFNPAVRHAINSYDWSSDPRVRYLDLDFVPGIFHKREDIYRQMWGGLALAYLNSDVCHTPPTRACANELMFEEILKVSSHSEERRVDAP